MDVQDLYARAQDIAPWTVEKRRALHRIPECGFQEFKTQRMITDTLSALNIPYTTERTWVIGTIGSGEGPTIALRADMDALPVVEPEGCAFRSEHDGWMHACGHDAHMAIQLAAARILREMTLPGTVRLLFQPAEETDGGAEPMVAAGAMQGVDAVYGLHVQPYMNVGCIDSRPGTLNAATDSVEIIVRGVSGHAARPEQCVDAIVCASQMVSTLQTVVSRSVTPLKPAVLTFRTLQGGDAPTVLCERDTLRGTLRTADEDIRNHLKNRIKEICRGTAEAFGAEAEVTITSGYCALINDSAEVDRVFRLGRILLGEKNVSLREAPSMGGEDFSYFCAEAPGAFYHLGCASCQPSPTLHSRDFVLDERCLPIGAALECALVLDKMNEINQSKENPA